MTNNNLDCSATSCVYNNGGGCFAGSIDVDGRQATTTGNTTCSTYQDKSGGGFTNSTNAADSVGTGDILCKATNCKYNVDEACKADKVHINNDSSASCETFQVK